jgi:hypothetical protein
MPTTTPVLGLKKPAMADNVGTTISDLGANFDTLDKAILDKGSVPQILSGAAAATDASGNPTPDTTAFPPANYPLGTLFHATSYPAAVAGGSMVFRREGGAGAEVWKWLEGSFRASNSNGNYQRDADGWQRCRFLSGTAIATNTAFGNIFVGSAFVTLTFPATFAVQPEVAQAPEHSTGAAGWAGNVAITTTTVQQHIFSGLNTCQMFPGYVADGKWAA